MVAWPAPCSIAWPGGGLDRTRAQWRARGGLSGANTVGSVGFRWKLLGKSMGNALQMEVFKGENMGKP